MAVSPALEGGDELQHGFSTANGKQVVHPMHLTPHNRFWLKKEALLQGGIFWKWEVGENRKELT